jgi:pyridoxine kinase
MAKESVVPSEFDESGGLESRVLSLQSHVVSGYVGNKAASFPMQVLGIETDLISSCMFSNHTGYKKGARGPRTSEAQINEVVDGMEANGLLSNISHLLTGYAGREEVLMAVFRIIERIKAARRGADPPLTYVLDPVMGDNGKLYVDRSLIRVYRERMLPLATILTPNCFELSLLADVPEISSESGVVSACRRLHETAHIPTIIVTGVTFDCRPGIVSMIVSQIDGEAFALDTDRVDMIFTGSGDLCAALILAWSIRCPDNLKTACHRAMSTVSAVLRRTADAGPNRGACAMPELKLVQSIDDILNPPIHLVTMRALV